MPGAELAQESTNTESTSTHETVDITELVRRHESELDELRAEFSEAQAQIKVNYQTLLEHEELRQTLASARKQRIAEMMAFQGSTHDELDGPGDPETLHQLFDAMMEDRDADISALREARRRETEARTELETLRKELSGGQAKHSETSTALEAESLRLRQAHTELETLRDQLSSITIDHAETETALAEESKRTRRTQAELATAMQTISNYESALERSRQAISDRDLEIGQLQQHILQVEEARAADATAILESLDKYKT
ncbi:MAG: hypothetical protein ABIN55_07490 [Aeromicrobium sp.]